MNVFLVQDAVDDAQTHLQGVVELLDCAAAAPDELGAAGLEVIANQARLALDDLGRARDVLVDADADEDGLDYRFLHITPEEKQIAMHEGYKAGLEAGLEAARIEGRVEGKIASEAWDERRKRIGEALLSAGRSDEFAEAFSDKKRLNELAAELGID